MMEFVSWDDFPFPTEWKVKKFHGSKPPTRKGFKMKIDDEDEDQSQDEDFLGKAVVCHMQRLLEGVFFSRHGSLNSENGKLDV